MVQDWWNTGQAKSAQDNSTNKAYTAKLTGGANIDNSKALVSNLQNTFSGVKDGTTTQTARALESKLGQGKNWSSPKSAAGNALTSAVADTTAGWLNAAGTALKSDRKSGLAVDSGAAGMGGEGLEEVVSALANPALKTIYNGKSLRENYSDLDLNDVAYEGVIGALMGSIGGSVNILQTGRGNTQNYQQGNSRAFGGQMRNTNPADTLRNASLNTLYTAAESNTQRSKPYAAAYTTSVQQQRSTPYTANIGTAGHSQTVSYADAFRQMQAEQNMSADSEYAHYKELERKYLNGYIKAEEFEELRRLDNVWQGVDVPSKSAGTDGASEYARYKELEYKFIDGSIDEQEWNELLRLENVRGQFDVTRKHSNSELKAMQRERLGDRATPVERYSKPVIIRVRNQDFQNGLPIRGTAKTAVDKVDNSGVVLQRRIYGANGMAMKDFDTSDHDYPNAHPTGAHKHEFNYSKKKPRGKPLPLTEEELKEHGDIIKRGENYHD